MVAPALGQIWECLRDIDPEFMNTVAVTTAWEYNQLFQSLNEDPSLSLDYKKEQFARRRGHCAVKALCIAAGKHGVPYEFHKIECNGQRKILLKIGRVALIQEPILSLTEAPRASEYKRELAASHGLICQLELDLGDQPHRIRDRHCSCGSVTWRIRS